MQMDKIFLIFLLFQLCICGTVKRWRLNVVYEGEDSKIKLTPGKFSKIYFELTNEADLTFPFLEEDSYILKFKEDENIISLNETIILTPKENLVYSTYIGLKCHNSIPEEQKEYEIEIEVTPNEGKADDNSIEYSNFLVLINWEQLDIDLDILFTSMPKNSFNLFHINKELYNIDEIRIIAYENEKLNFEDIIIKSFNERERIEEENSENHGIFFDFPFGLNNQEEDLEENTFTFSIKLADDNKLQKCYQLSRKGFAFECAYCEGRSLRNIFTVLCVRGSPDRFACPIRDVALHHSGGSFSCVRCDSDLRIFFAGSL